MADRDANDFDVVILGGGPAGATAALRLARAGRRVVVLEKSSFPRFRLGESFLPRNYALLCELGLEKALRNLPQVPKYGAEFAMGDAGPDEGSRFWFNPEFSDGQILSFNLERAPFDQMLLDEARAVGAQVRENAPVREILQLTDGAVVVSTGTATIRARYLLDATGQNTLVARRMKTRRTAEEPYLQKVAYYGHFEKIHRPAGKEAGHPCIVMCREGWFWLIPINEKITSVGLVIDKEISRTRNIPASRMLAWGIDRCPFVRRRCRGADISAPNEVMANFSYDCRPYAGEGYFLLGDAAAFLDPIFSTGVCLAMMSAVKAADEVDAILNGKTSPQSARRRYGGYIDSSSRPLRRLIRNYYDPAFRDLFLEGEGPMQIHKAVLAVLAGHVFPRPKWRLRWRLALFQILMRIHRTFPLAPRKGAFSLLEQKPAH